MRRVHVVKNMLDVSSVNNHRMGENRLTSAAQTDVSRRKRLHSREASKAVALQTGEKPAVFASPGLRHSEASASGSLPRLSLTEAAGVSRLIAAIKRLTG